MFLASCLTLLFIYMPTLAHSGRVLINDLGTYDTSFLKKSTRNGTADPAETHLADIYGNCPEDNAVCVAIRFRNPKPSSDCTEACDKVASRMTTTLMPGEDGSFPKGCDRCVEIDTGKGKQRHWAYDVIFPYDEGTGVVAPNEDVYKGLVKPTLSKAFGCERPNEPCQSASFFAYGATGSGKSFTMGFEKDKTDGMMQMGIQQMFETLERLKAAGHPLGNQKVYMAYYELYGADGGGSKVFDLLGKGTSKGKGLRGSRDKVLCSLTYKPVSNLKHMMTIFGKGNDKRAVGGTGMNAVSSRSHAVAQFYLSEKPIDKKSAEILSGKKAGRTQLLAWLLRSVQVVFVDLAGSEPAGKWDDKQRVAEGITINKALTALRQCIAAVADPKKNTCSTRADMLTEMLKTLFEKGKNGKAKTFTRMLATFNPSADPNQVALSKGTMQYASTVKSIKIKAPQGLMAGNLVKVTPAQEIAQLKTKIAELEAKNEQLTNEITHLQQSSMPCAPQSDEASSPQSDEASSPQSDEELRKVKELVEYLTLENKRLSGDARNMTAMENAIIEVQEEVDMCLEEKAVGERLLTASESASQLATSQQKACAAQVADLMQEVADLRARAVDPEVLKTRRENACTFTHATGAALVSWDEQRGVEVALEKLQELNRAQEDREALIDMLKKKGGEDLIDMLKKKDEQKTSFSAWFSLSSWLTPVNRRFLDVSNMITGVESEIEDVRKEQRSLLQKALDGIDSFQNSYIITDPTDHTDPEDVSSTRFTLLAQNLKSSIDIVKEEIVMSSNPGSVLEGLEQQVNDLLCSGMQFFQSQAGDEEQCPLEMVRSIERICSTDEDA